ncbi:MAG: hypothetical protein HY399_00805 [Elusimicrobia bacterium]|nr:hypothetical protein [Elusimicrobiota bacterium]
MKIKTIFTLFLGILLLNSPFSLPQEATTSLAPPIPITVIGRLKLGDPNIIHQETKISEFSLEGSCNSFNNLYTSNEKIKAQLLSLLGKQVLISGIQKELTLDEVRRGNPGSECLKYLSNIMFSYIEVKKVQPTTFYRVVIPQKVTWNGPIKIRLVLKNPLPRSIRKLQINITSKFYVYSVYKKEINLPARKQTTLPILLELNDPSYAKTDGTSLHISMVGSGKNFQISFHDEIASYSRFGTLKPPKK